MDNTKPQWVPNWVPNYFYNTWNSHWKFQNVTSCWWKLLTTTGGAKPKNKLHWVYLVPTLGTTKHYNETINVVHMALLAILLKMGLSYNWWKKGINIMLENSLGNFQVNKLWIILLFEVDFNHLSQHIGQLMMYHVEQYSLVSSKQYGSCHGCSSITQSLNKWLMFDHMHQLKQATIICSNDAKSCYNCIIHHIAAQSMYWCGVNKTMLICMFSTIQHLKHHIWTLFGDSEISAGTDLWAVPVSILDKAMGQDCKSGQW